MAQRVADRDVDAALREQEAADAMLREASTPAEIDVAIRARDLADARLRAALQRARAAEVA